MKNRIMFSVAQAARRLGVCTKTIRRWDIRGLIHCQRTPGNHRRIPLSEINRLLHLRHAQLLQEPTKKQCAIYARVSGHRQKTDGDLDRQLRLLMDHCRAQFRTSPVVFTDVGSGLNMRRRGPRRLLTLAQRGTIRTVIITHRDRLACFGVDLIERILDDYCVKMIILLQEDEKTPQEELVTDKQPLQVVSVKCNSYSEPQSVIVGVGFR